MTQLQLLDADEYFRVNASVQLKIKAVNICDKGVACKNTTV